MVYSWIRRQVADLSRCNLRGTVFSYEYLEGESYAGHFLHTCQHPQADQKGRLYHLPLSLTPGAKDLASFCGSEALRSLHSCAL